MRSEGRRFVKGQVANPRGRPRKDASIAEHFRFRLRQPMSDEDRQAAITALADTAVTQALGGDVAWAKLLLDRAFGAVPQVIHGDPTQPVRFVFSWGDPHDDDHD
jgi:hypothetical protein